MIVTTRTLTCNFCGVWAYINHGETARDARRRWRRFGWCVLPYTGQLGEVRDACPGCADKVAS